MNIKLVIAKINEFDENDAIYAQKINGNFLPESEIAIVKNSDEEMDWPTQKIADKHCKGKDYFLEIFLIKELIEDYSNMNLSHSEFVNKIIYYAEHDA